MIREAISMEGLARGHNTRLRCFYNFTFMPMEGPSTIMDFAEKPNRITRKCELSKCSIFPKIYIQSLFIHEVPTGSGVAFSSRKVYCDLSSSALFYSCEQGEDFSDFLVSWLGAKHFISCTNEKQRSLCSFAFQYRIWRLILVQAEQIISLVSQGAICIQLYLSDALKFYLIVTPHTFQV